MDKNTIPDTTSLDTQSSPEEDIALLAIEALEAQTVDPHPKPWSPSPRPTHASHPDTAALQRHAVKVIEPVISPSVHSPAVSIPAPRPTSAPPSPVVQPKPAPIAPIEPVVAPSKPDVTPAVAAATVEKPKRPATASEEMAEELAKSPARSYFQFFLNQKPSRKLFIIITTIIIVFVIGVAAYLILR